MGHQWTILRAATAVSAFAAATCLGTAQARAADPALVIQAPARYYTYPAGEGPQGGDLFLLHLNLERAEGEEPLAEDVELTIDASALKGKAVLKPTNGSCKDPEKDLVFSCSYGSIDGKTSVQPFHIQGAEGVKPGYAGLIEYTATASNAPSAKAKTKVFIDGPRLAERKHAPLKVTAPGSTVEVTPGVANHGQLAADQGIGIKLYGVDGVEVAREHSNCHYKTWAGTSAYCLFETPLEPGAAYEFSEPFRFKVSPALMYGSIGYSTWAIGSGDPWEYEQPEDFAETGSRAPLTLKLVDDKGFEDFGGHTELTTTQHADFRAVTGTLEGRVGETVPLTLGARNEGPGSMDLTGYSSHGTGTYEVTPPEGTTITSIPFPGEEDDWACSPKKKGSRTHVCGIDERFESGEQDTLVFNVRLDRKVKGAEGRITVTDRADYPTRDTEPGNNTAAIPVKITGSDGTGGGPAAGGKSGGPASGASADTSGTSGADAGATSGGTGTGGGSMAGTGAGGIGSVLGASAVLAVAGATALALARRRQARS
ncbi:hypothetical protein ABZW18_17205 [Streptomyces sp. NPDC004647]|uniref:hypothetical protein n=1 Tax=Streptomyces sp. NPDC004647 TaxID=3154671 RepID=UPI0033AC0A88